MDATSNKAFSPRPATAQAQPRNPSAPSKSIHKPSTGRGENLFDRIPPHSTEIEKSVIGAMIVERVACEYAIEMLRPDHFYVDRNRWLFTKCVATFRIRKALDETLLIANLGAVENLNEVRDYIGRLISNTPTAANIENYCDELLRFAQDRKRWNFALRIIREMTAAMPAVAQK